MSTNMLFTDLLLSMKNLVETNQGSKYAARFQK